MILGIGIGMNFGGGKPFSPADLSGLSLWLRGDLGITLNGSNVSAWADQSRNGYNFSQATASAQPTYNATDSNFNNRPTVQADGGDALASALVNLTGAKTIFCVYRFTTIPGVGGSASLFSLQKSDESLFTETLFINTIGGYQTVTFKHDFQVNAASVGHTFTLNTNPRLLEQTYDGGTNTSTASYTERFDGTSQAIVASGNVARTIGHLSSILGRVDATGTPTSSLTQASIAELIVYGRVLATEEATTVRAYLANRYAITIA